MIQQVLACGVHGLNMIFSSSPGAVREFVRAARYSFAPQAAGIAEGTRGSGSQGFAAEIWGVSRNEYTLKADPWPLNPEGELLLGVKIETHHAVPNIEELTRISGIGLAEWASTDMGYSLLGVAALQPASERTRQQLTRMNAARSRLLAATKAANIAFLQTCGENNTIDLLKEGVMICGGGGDGPGSMKGREFTKRPRPW
jgi:4-hydroxy-2-oxoheptanedioate aldolase